MRIKLRGMLVGDGMFQPSVQSQGLGDYLYQLGLASYAEREYWRAADKKMYAAVSQNDTHAAFLVWDELLLRSQYPYPSYFNNITGFPSYYNIGLPRYPPNPWEQWVNSSAARTALHAGDRAFNPYNRTAGNILADDIFRNIGHLLPPLLENYKVLIYFGQYDIILPAPPFENFLQTLEWRQAAEWRSATKRVLRLPNATTPIAYDQATKLFPSSSSARLATACSRTSRTECSTYCRDSSTTAGTTK